MSRGTNRNLSLWDVNRIPLIGFLMCSGQDVELVVEHRARCVSLTNANGHVVKCAPRCAVLINLMNQKLHQEIQKFIELHQEVSDSEEILLLKEILNQEMARV